MLAQYGFSGFAVLHVVADTTAPAPLSNVSLNGTGLAVSGTGEAGATVSVTNAAGTVLGTAVVNADGYPLGAVNISVPFSRWNLEDARSQLAPKVINTARTISSATRSLRPVG